MICCTNVQISGDVLAVFIIIIVVKAVYILRLLLFPLYWRFNWLASILYYLKESIILGLYYFQNGKEALLLNHLTNIEGLICINISSDLIWELKTSSTVTPREEIRWSLTVINVSVHRHFWPFSLQDSSKQGLIYVYLYKYLLINFVVVGHCLKKQ